MEERIATLQAYYSEMSKSIACLSGMKKDVAVLQNDVQALERQCKKYDSTCDDFIRYQERQANMEKRVESIAKRIKNLESMLKSYPDIASSYKSAKDVVVSNLVKWGLAAILIVIASVAVNVGWKMVAGA